jgi:hypothetical protein
MLGQANVWAGCWKLPAITDALRRRGTAELAADLTAMTAVSVFKVAVESWIDATDDRDLSQHIHESLDELKTLVADG